MFAMLLRENEGVTDGYRILVENRHELLIFVDSVRRCLSPDYIAEEAVQIATSSFGRLVML